MKKGCFIGFCFTVILSGLFLVAGCHMFDSEVLPSEDIEAPIRNAKLIEILKNPKLTPNSKEKYEAINELMEHVDFSLTRETKTLNDFFAPNEAIVERLPKDGRNITFNFQYQGRYTRLKFYCYREFIFRVDISRKNGEDEEVTYDFKRYTGRF